MNYTEEEKNLITLSSFGEMTYGERSALAALKSFSPDFGAVGNSLIKRRGVGVYNKVRDKFYDPAYRGKVFAYLEKRGVECITLASKGYPQYLKEITSPPLVLFALGDRKLLERPCLAMVGSRVTPPKMLAVCSSFAGELSEKFTVVTGSATGADTAVLEGTGGRAVSVLAFGFNCVSGESNRNLLEKVAKEGLLLTEHFPNVTARSYYFPVRNRIIAGLSRGALIVSAGKKSGALITADYAAEFSREVFAIPYSLGVAAGEGCNNLIKKGATVCLSPADIFEAFGIQAGEREVELSEEERRVYSLIREAGEAFVPELADKLGVPAFRLLPVLSALEIKGVIVRIGGNRYSSGG